MAGRFFPITGVHLGTSGSFAAFNESTLNNGGAGPHLGQLGQVFEDSGNCYRLVRRNNTADVTTTVGGVGHWKDRANYVVTSKASEAQAGVNGVAGAFLLASHTNGNYCFVQMGGLQAVVVNTTAAAGTALTGTTTDETLVAITTNTLGNQLIYGISYGTNSTTSANMYWLVGNLI